MSSKNRPEEANILLSLEKVSVSWGTTTVIEDINWKVSRGQHCMVVGEVASGKTTLARAVMGQARISKGQLSFPALANLPDQERRKLVLFAAFDAQLKHPDLIETHYYQQRFQAFDSDGLPSVRDYLNAQTDVQIDDVLDALEIEDLLPREMIKLSSGQNRRVALAAHLLQFPRLLLIDNLEVGLDDEMRTKIENWLGAVCQKFNTTLILFGHDSKPPSYIEQKFVLPQPEATTNPALLPWFDERARSIEAFPGTTTAFNFQQVNLKYGKNAILEDFNWEVRRGEKWSIVGQNGSGKSSLISLIYGDHPQAYSNELYVFGEKRGAGTSIWDLKKHMGFTSPEIQRYFSKSMCVADFLSTGYSDSEHVVELNEAQEETIKQFLTYFGYSNLRGAYLHQLSDGTKRALYFVRALLKNPPILLLDEPFQGMSPRLKEACLKLLEACLSKQHTLVFITHFVNEIPDCVDRCLYLTSNQPSPVLSRSK